MPDEKEDEWQSSDDLESVLAWGMQLQMPADRIVQDARVLILSMHGGSAKDTAMHIHSAGVRQENIICVVWLGYAFLVDSSPCVRDAKLEAIIIPLVERVAGFFSQNGDLQGQFVANDSWVERFAHGAADALAGFDVLWADFPAVFALLFDRVAPHKLIVRPTHRFDQNTERLPVNSTDYTHHNLLRVMRSAPVVFAGSEYDWWYIKFYSCREAQRLYMSQPTTFFESLVVPRRLTLNSAFIMWGGSNNGGKGSENSTIKITFDAIEGLAGGRVPRVPVKFRPSSFVHTSQFASQFGVVYIPYSMPSTALHELYASGVPILAPSLEFMLAEFATGRGYPHKTAATGIFFAQDPKSGPCSTPSFYAGAESEFCCESEGCLDPNSCAPDALRQWVARGDLYTTPHITYFHDAMHAVTIMEEWIKSPERRSEVIELMRLHMLKSIKTSTATLQDAIRTIRNQHTPTRTAAPAIAARGPRQEEVGHLKEVLEEEVEHLKEALQHELHHLK
jgi:hypothetical protein